MVVMVPLFEVKPWEIVASTEIVASNDAVGVVHARHFVGGRGSAIGNKHPDPPYNIRHGVTGDRYGTGVRLAEDPPAAAAAEMVVKFT